VSENPFTDAFADLGACDMGLTIEQDTDVGPLPEDLDGWLAHRLDRILDWFQRYL
jgi:hypothetical protein